MMLIIHMRRLKLNSFGISVVRNVKSNGARKNFGPSSAVFGTPRTDCAEIDLGSSFNGTANLTNGSSQADARRQVGFGLTLFVAVCRLLPRTPRLVHAHACGGLV